MLKGEVNREGERERETVLRGDRKPALKRKGNGTQRTGGEISLGKVQHVFP